MAKKRALFDSGPKLFSWTAHDYHPHDRGLSWYIVFCLLFFGISFWAVLTDPQWGWITAFSLCVSAAIYLYIHREGEQDHEVQIFEKGLQIDGHDFIHWEKVEAFWFTYDETVSIINFDLKKNPNNPKKLQMGQVTPDRFREIMKEVKLPEAEGKEESVADLWIRVLKL